MTDANTNDLFSQATNGNEQIDYLGKVKEKFNVNGELDVNGLAKGKVEADNFIEQLKRENEELRQKAASGKSIEDLLAAIRTNQGQSGNLNEEPTRETDTNKPISQSSTEDLQKLINETLETQKRASIEETNKNVVIDKLNEVWGASAASELGKKARDLGISVKQLEQMGKESPKALFTLLGLSATQVPGSASSVPRSTTSAYNSNGTANGERGKSYYDKLYRENPKLRFDAKITAQEHRDAIKLGERFFEI